MPTAVVRRSFFARALSILAAGVVVLLASTSHASCPGTPTVSAAYTQCSPSVTLSWGFDGNAWQWEVYRSTSPTTGFVRIGTIFGTSVDDARSSTQTYYYMVRGTQQVFLCPSGFGPFSSVVTVPPYTPTPSDITGLTGTSTCSGVDFSWDPQPGITQYSVRVYWGNTLLSQTTQPGTTFSYTTTNTITLLVHGISACGNGPDAGITLSPIPPQPTPADVTGLILTPSCSGVTVSWNPVPGAARYHVLLSIGGTTQTVEAFPTATSYQYSNNQATYWVARVSAINICGVEGHDAPNAVTGLGGPPQQIRAFSAALRPCGGVLVEWVPGDGAVRFVVSRGGVNLSSTTDTRIIDLSAPTGVPLQYCITEYSSCDYPTYRLCPLTITVPSISVTDTPTTIRRSVGQSGSLSVTATGVSSYQWRKNGNPLANDGRISGATSPQLTINALTTADTDVYDVVLAQPGATPMVLTAGIVVVNPCRSDYDGSGARDVQDIFAFLSDWFGACP